MGVGKNHALVRELVDVRGFDLTVLRVQALHVAVAEVVTHDEDDVRAQGLCGCMHCQQAECCTQNNFDVLFFHPSLLF